jgi:hypothetical protein
MEKPRVNHGYDKQFVPEQCSQQPDQGIGFSNWLGEVGLLVLMFGDRFSNWLRGRAFGINVWRSVYQLAKRWRAFGISLWRSV